MASASGEGESSSFGKSEGQSNFTSAPAPAIYRFNTPEIPDVERRALVVAPNHHEGGFMLVEIKFYPGNVSPVARPFLAIRC
jgi:hypothetical protein